MKTRSGQFARIHARNDITSLLVKMHNILNHIVKTILLPKSTLSSHYD